MFFAVLFRAAPLPGTFFFVFCTVFLCFFLTAKNIRLTVFAVLLFLSLTVFHM